MRKHVAAVLAAALALGIAGCQGGEPAPAGEAQQDALDFDGSGMSDTGAGTMVLYTEGGSSEGGNVPTIPSGYSLAQAEVDYWDGDGTQCTVYVDGVENSRITAANVQQPIDLEGDALSPGTHTVEVVGMDGETVTVYKSAQYQVAE